MSVSAVISDQTCKSLHLNTVAFCVDENYLPYATFVAMQIRKIDPYPIDICICVPDLGCVPDFFKSLSIRFIALDIQGIHNLPTDHLSIAAYHRLFLPELLKQDYSHIIYLDADVYIRKPFLTDIFAFIATCCCDFSVAAAPYMGEIERLTFPEMLNRKIENYLLRYHKLDHLYRNSGVLVFNVHNYVKENALQHIFNVAANNLDKLESHDQSALNLALLKNIEHLPIQFNWQLNAFSASIIEEVDPFILHFVNVNKPWVTRIYYLDCYITEYETFLAKYYKNLKFRPLTIEDKRYAKPKYKGLKEKISSFRSVSKSQKKQKYLRNFYMNNKDKIFNTFLILDK